MGKVPFDRFYIWFCAWSAVYSEKNRLGQDFCNDFHKTIGRGDHTKELFYCVEDRHSLKLIYENFVERGTENEH